MTKLEYGKCEKLMEEAIRTAKLAQNEYGKSEDYGADGDSIMEDVEQRKADQHYGYAEGINQVLVTVGFKHDRMRVLSELL